MGENWPTCCGRAGNAALLASPGADYRRLERRPFPARSGRPAGFAQLWAEAAAAGVRQVVHLWGLDAAAPEATTAARWTRRAAACDAVLHLAQALARAANAPSLCVVTRGAQAVDAGESVCSRPGAAVGTRPRAGRRASGVALSADRPRPAGRRRSRRQGPGRRPVRPGRRGSDRLPRRPALRPAPGARAGDDVRRAAKDARPPDRAVRRAVPPGTGRQGIARLPDAAAGAAAAARRRRGRDRGAGGRA